MTKIHPAGENPFVWCLTRHAKQLTSELQASELEGDKPIADFNDVNERVEVVWCQDEAVSRAVGAPATQQQISTQRMLQWAGQMLIKDRV